MIGRVYDGKGPGPRNLMHMAKRYPIRDIPGLVKCQVGTTLTIYI